MHEKRILQCERAEIGRRRPMRATRRYVGEADADDHPPPRAPRGRKYRNSADGRETDTAS